MASNVEAGAPLPQTPEDSENLVHLPLLLDLTQRNEVIKSEHDLCPNLLVEDEDNLRNIPINSNLEECGNPPRQTW